jgi:hypothetical protein
LRKGLCLNFARDFTEQRLTEIDRRVLASVNEVRDQTRQQAPSELLAGCFAQTLREHHRNALDLFRPKIHARFALEISERRRETERSMRLELADELVSVGWQDPNRKRMESPQTDRALCGYLMNEPIAPAPRIVVDRKQDR